MTMKKNMDIVICGVGGQGVVLTSKVLAAAALIDGFDVKASEVHGMAQRGGSVLSQVRIAEKVYSPTIEEGRSSLMISFEMLEAARHLSLMKKDAVLVVNMHKIDPLPVVIGKAVYPDGIVSRLSGEGCRVLAVHGTEEMKKRNFPARAINVFLLGAASLQTPISEKSYLLAIENCVPPKTVDVNTEVFRSGRSFSAQ